MDNIFNLQVKELIINKDPNLLDSFLDVSLTPLCILYLKLNLSICVYYLQEVIAFQQDPSSDVRKFVIGFMEDAWWVHE